MCRRGEWKTYNSTAESAGFTQKASIEPAGWLFSPSGGNHESSYFTVYQNFEVRVLPSFN